jgi:hypothetical protein
MWSSDARVSSPSRWPIDLQDVPTLLRLLDEHALTVDIQVIGYAGEVAIRAAGVCCRQEGCCLCLDLADASVSIDLDRLRTARAVRHVWGCLHRMTLELAGADGEYRFSVSGSSDPAGVWTRVMEALAVVPDGHAAHHGVTPIAARAGQGAPP